MNSMLENGVSRTYSRVVESLCPYFDESIICNASLTLFVPAVNVRTDFCGSEDYDNCPIFLAKVLRRR